MPHVAVSRETPQFPLVSTFPEFPRHQETSQKSSPAPKHDKGFICLGLFFFFSTFPYLVAILSPLQISALVILFLCFGRHGIQPVFMHMLVVALEFD